MRTVRFGGIAVFPGARTDLGLYDRSEEIGLAACGVGKLVLRGLVELEEDPERAGNAFNTEEIISA